MRYGTGRVERMDSVERGLGEEQRLTWFVLEIDHLKTWSTGGTQQK